MDFANHPGQLFVVATLLPLASFLFLLVCFAIRSALRSSKEGTAGAAIYQALGGDVPPKWPAWVATAAIGLACVLCVIGAVRYVGGHEEIEQSLHKLDHDTHSLEGKLHDAKGAEKQRIRD